MFQIDDPTAVAVMPTPEAAGTAGYFTEGNPATNTPATNMRASYFNGLMKEIMNVLAEMGTTPSKTTYTQLRDSIYGMIAAKSVASKATAGYQKFPSGLILQWGQTGNISSGGSVSVALPVAFPTAGLCATATWLQSVTGTGGIIIATNIPTTTNISIYNYGASIAVATWLAIGY